VRKVEFFEELIKPKILDAQIFSQIKYKHLKRISKNLKWSEHFSCYEVLIYDIMELLPTEQQNEELKKLSRDTNLKRVMQLLILMILNN